MTLHIALQLTLSSAAVEGGPFARRDRRRGHGRPGHNAGLFGSGIERLTSLQCRDFRIVNRLARGLQARPALDRPFLFQNAPGLSRVVDVQSRAFLAGNDRHRGIPPHAFKRHGSILSGDRVEFEIGRRSTRSQARKFIAADVVILAIDEHARRVSVAERLVRDEDPLPLAPLSHRSALSNMPRLVDRDLVRAVTHHAPHANQNATQCARRREVAALNRTIDPMEGVLA